MSPSHINNGFEFVSAEIQKNFIFFLFFFLINTFWFRFRTLNQKTGTGQENLFCNAFFCFVILFLVFGINRATWWNKNGFKIKFFFYYIFLWFKFIFFPLKIHSSIHSDKTFCIYKYIVFLGVKNSYKGCRQGLNNNKKKS